MKIEDGDDITMWCRFVRGMRCSGNKLECQALEKVLQALETGLVDRKTSYYGSLKDSALLGSYLGI